MPWINGRFYASPLYGMALERARSIDVASRTRFTNEQEADAHCQLSSRDKAYLDAYYDAVSAWAKHYNVDPTLVLGVGIESGFASAGT